MVSAQILLRGYLVANHSVAGFVQDRRVQASDNIVHCVRETSSIPSRDGGIGRDDREVENDSGIVETLVSCLLSSIPQSVLE